MPAYNEASRLGQAVEQVLAVKHANVRREVIIVDDGSSDGSSHVIAGLAQQGLVRAYTHDRNLGKGAALRTGMAQVLGEFIVIQDADLEYDPAEHERLLAPLLSGSADVVFGNRMHAGNPVGYRRYWLGNYLISAWASLLFGRRLHDVETGFKAFRRSLVQGLQLRANRFDFEVEFTARVLGSGARVLEVPITYRPRKFTEGKKITWRDGVAALWLLAKYRIMN